MHRFEIDPRTGDLVFPDLDARIMRLSKWKDLPAEISRLAGRGDDMRTGWIWRNVNPLAFGGLAVGTMLGFHDQGLETLYFSVIADREGQLSEPERMEEVKMLTRVLEQQLGIKLENGQARFEWGTAYCSYDPKGGFTSVGLNYVAT